MAFGIIRVIELWLEVSRLNMVIKENNRLFVGRVGEGFFGLVEI